MLTAPLQNEIILHTPKAFQYKIQPKTSFASSSVRATHVLLIGDSVDRSIVEDWCVESSKRSSTYIIGEESVWNDGSITYQSSHTSMNLCYNAEGDSLAFTHHFGSHATGPYATMLSTGPLVASNARIGRTMHLYLTKVGRPARVFYSSAMWDAVSTMHRSYSSNNTLLDTPGSVAWVADAEMFEAQVNARLDDILAAVALHDNSSAAWRPGLASFNGVEVAVRTACWVAKQRDRLLTYNDVMRRIAARRNLTVYDFDRDCWGTMKDNAGAAGSYWLRDFVHPRTPFTATAGDKMLALAHSAYFHYRGAHPATLAKRTALRSSFALPAGRQVPPGVIRVSLLRALGPNETAQEYDRQRGTVSLYAPEPRLPDEAGWHTFYTAVLDDGRRYRWANASLAFMHKSAHLLGDIYYVSREELEAIPLRPGPPPRFNAARPDAPTNPHTTWNSPDDWDVDAAVNNTKGPHGEGLALCQITHGPLNLVVRTRKGGLSHQGGIIKRPVGSLESMGFYQRMFNVSLHTGIQDYDIKSLATLPSVPNIYFDGAIIKNESGPEIYLYRNFTRHLLPPSSGANGNGNGNGTRGARRFVHQEPTVAKSADIDVIPLGEPLHFKKKKKKAGHIPGL